METYKLVANDGIEHFLTILEEMNDYYNVTITHRINEYKMVTQNTCNKCLIEKLLSLGMLKKVS
ncbi:MAG: hypothetical protein AB1798_02350 [Spirochaetota bacterium]